MSSSTKTLTDVESRRDTRAPLLATAALSRDGEALGVWRAVNLSAGGALLRGPQTIPVGTSVEATLRLPWTPAIRIEAVVVRNEAGPGDGEPAHTALAFSALPAVEADVIHSAVVHFLRKARSARV